MIMYSDHNINYGDCLISRPFDIHDASHRVHLCHTRRDIASDRDWRLNSRNSEAGCCGPIPTVRVYVVIKYGSQIFRFLVSVKHLHIEYEVSRMRMPCNFYH